MFRQEHHKPTWNGVAGWIRLAVVVVDVDSNARVGRLQNILTSVFSILTG